MLNIRCPNCEDMIFLSLATWENFIGFMELGRAIRIGLVCPQCHTDFILQMTLSEVMKE